MQPRGQLGFVSAVFAALVSTLASPLQAQDPDTYEIIIQLRVQRGPGDIVFAYGSDSLMLVPVSRLLELAEIGIGEIVDTVSLSGVLETTDERFEFNTVRRRIRRGNTSDTLPDSEFLWDSGELFVSAPRAAWVLGATTDVSWSDLSVIITGAEHLPVMRRLRRETRRRLIAGDDGTARTRLPPGELRAIDGGVLDWEVSSSTRDPVGNYGFTAGLGASLFGGSLDFRVDHRNTNTFSSTLYDYSWLRAWPENRWLRQVAVGEVTTTGVAPRGVRGALITNRPFLRSSEFGVDRLTGTLTPGWEVELYRAGQLVDYDRVGMEGTYDFPVRVRYGPNPLELVAFGPRGERITLRRTFEVPFERLPEGETEYAITGGECQASSCEAALNVDIRHGVYKWLTVGVGHEVFARDSLADIWQPYLSLNAALSRAVSLGFEAVHRGRAIGRFVLAPSQDLRAALTHSRFSDAIESPLIGSASIRHSTSGSVFWRPIGADEGLFIQLNGDRSVGERSLTTNGSIAATMSQSGVRASGSIQFTRFESESGSAFENVRLNVGAGTTLRLPGSVLDGLFVSALTSMDTDGELIEASGGIGKTIFTSWRVDLNGGWRRSGGAVFSLAVGTQLPYMRFLSRNSHTDASGVQGTQTFEGTVLWNQVNQQAEFSSGRGQGRGGVGGTVFLDENRDGDFDTNEMPVEGVLLRIGARTVTSDESGRYNVWDLVPFESIPMDIDTLSIANPLWVPAVGPATIAPGPNGFRRLDIPLVEAGEVSGTVVMLGTDRSLQGVRVILRREGSADLVAQTFSDGSYYLLGVPPGDYVVLIDPIDARRIGVAQVPVHASVGVGTPTLIDIQVTPVRSDL